MLFAVNATSCMHNSIQYRGLGTGAASRLARAPPPQLSFPLRRSLLPHQHEPTHQPPTTNPTPAPPHPSPSPPKPTHQPPTANRQPQVPDSLSVERTYILFRTMGLRHLVVVDEHHRVKVSGLFYTMNKPFSLP
jgi:hypothetical protein